MGCPHLGRWRPCLRPTPCAVISGCSCNRRRESGREQDESREGLVPRVVEVILVAVAGSPVARHHRGGERVWTARDVLRHVSARVAPVVTGDDDNLRQEPFHLRAPAGCVCRVSQVPKGKEERHSSRSSTSQESEGIVIAGSPKVSRGGKREVRGGLVLPARLGGIERALLDRRFLEQDPSRGPGDEEGESEDGDRSPTEGGGPVSLSWNPSRFLDVAADSRCLFRSSIRLSAFEGLHPCQRLPQFLQQLLVGIGLDADGPRPRLHAVPVSRGALPLVDEGGTDLSNLPGRSNQCPRCSKINPSRSASQVPRGHPLHALRSRTGSVLSRLRRQLRPLWLRL